VSDTIKATDKRKSIPDEAALLLQEWKEHLKFASAEFAIARDHFARSKKNLDQATIMYEALRKAWEELNPVEDGGPNR
jgi:hypothetical protein